MFKAILKKEILFRAVLLGGVLCIAPLASPIASYAQIVGGDLGSSSSLFKGKGKPKNTSTTSSAPKKAAAKKPAPKVKNTTAVAKPAAKNTGGGTPTVARNANRNVYRPRQHRPECRGAV